MFISRIQKGLIMTAARREELNFPQFAMSALFSSPECQLCSPTHQPWNRSPIAPFTSSRSFWVKARVLVDVFSCTEEVLVHDGYGFGMGDGLYFGEVDLLHWIKINYEKSGVYYGLAVWIKSGLRNTSVSVPAALHVGWCPPVGKSLTGLHLRHCALLVFGLLYWGRF